MNIKLAKSEIIHFVGIGGIGMSGLSLIMKGKGFKVQGSDISNNKNIDRLKKEGASEIRLLCLLAAPEGVARMKEAHPDVPIFTASLDEKLNEHGYIVPGLGDAGDRMFGTQS